MKDLLLFPSAPSRGAGSETIQNFLKNLDTLTRQMMQPQHQLGKHLWALAVHDWWVDCLPTVNARYLVSRNKREGRYAGRIEGRHCRESQTNLVQSLEELRTVWRTLP